MEPIDPFRTVAADAFALLNADTVRVLACLNRSPATIDDLAERTHFSKAKLYRMIAELMKKSWVEVSDHIRRERGKSVNIYISTVHSVWLRLNGDVIEFYVNEELEAKSKVNEEIP